MPTVSSSPITVLSRQLASLGEVAPQARGGLLEVLESVPDPRKKRGVRHRFSAILFVSVCAVVSGARSFAAIAEWSADAVSDAVDDTLRGMGIGTPNASTIRRALSAFTGDGFDTAIGAWLSGRVTTAWVPGRRRRRAIAVDGKATARLPRRSTTGTDGDGVPGPRQRVTLGQVESLRRATKSPCSRHFWTRSPM